ncbi:MAG: hypothetical protein GY711_20290 [bacterium]|nr:hypothetical protein [bacterium]
MLSPLLALPLFTCPAPCASPVPISPDVRIELDEEFDKRLEEAGKDPKALWDLVLWCESTERDKNVRKVLLKLVRVEPDHREARAKLGHEHFDGKWFTSEKKLAAYKKKQAKERAEELGLVEYEGEWVRPEDVPFLEKGMVKNDEGRWVSKEELEKIEAGWIRQDLVWVAPDEIEKISEGLWKCGDEWLSLEAANAWHAEFGRWWRIPGDHVLLSTTCDRETAMKALDELERAYRDLVRAYGSPTPDLVELLVLRDVEQMERIAEGNPEFGFPATDGAGMANSGRAFFADGWFDPESKKWNGMGVSFWDVEAENGEKFAVHDVRLALGLSYANIMDPSPKAVAKAEKKGPGSRWVEDFESEKKLPTWFRWGSAAHTSRWYEATVERGGDPLWVRKWSSSNLSAQGGLHSWSTLFDFPISGDNAETTRLVNEAGLLVAFMLDGKCTPVTEAHGAIKQALKEGKDTGKIFAQLRKELEKHEAELRAFAGL